MKTDLIDIQSQPASIPIRINRVGIRNLKMPLTIKLKGNTAGQRTIGIFSLAVDLPESSNGTHMSRFVDELQALACESKGLDYSVALTLLQKTCKRLNSSRAHLSIKFPFFLSKKAPVSEISSMVCYECFLDAEITENNLNSNNISVYNLGITVPVMTVCPCSKAISDEGAHSQRTNIKICIKMKSHIWLEDIIELVEKSGSSPVYSLLKRPDEKYVTETAFANPRFVEDVARNTALALGQLENLASFSVEVESLESIHAHNAFAYIEG